MRQILFAAAIALAVFLVAVPASAWAATAPPTPDARAWVLIDPRDDSVLAAKAANKRLPIASATKLMTAYLALHELKPNSRADSDWIHSATGGLSTVMKLPASSEPKNIAFQLTEPAFTAAA